MLEIRNLTKTYSAGEKKAVDDISFNVEKGEIFGFLGPNGAGKTTTIKMIVGLLKPDEGQVRINGIDMWEEPLAAKQLISYVPDQPVIYDKLTGIQFLNFIADMHGVPSQTRLENFEKYSSLFNIDRDLNRLVEGYSHGMRQKLLLTAALTHDPDLLILDEPLVGLDPKSSYNLKEVMEERCKRGKSVFFSTHVLEVAENICDRLGIISQGEIISIGGVDELKSEMESEDSLEKIFLELTKNG